MTTVSGATATAKVIPRSIEEATEDRIPHREISHIASFSKKVGHDDYVVK